MVPTLVAGQNLVVPTCKTHIAIRVEGGQCVVYALRVASSGHMRSADDLVSALHHSCADGSVQYRGTASAGLQAQFAIDLEQVPTDVEKVVILLSTFNHRISAFSFISVAAETVDQLNGSHLFQANITTQKRTESALILGEFYRYKEQWKFRLVDQGSNEGLQSLLAQYAPQDGQLLLDEDEVRRVQAAQREAAAPSAASTSSSSSGSTSAARVNLKKVSLTKAQPKVNLGKVQHLEHGDGFNDGVCAMFDAYGGALLTPEAADTVRALSDLAAAVRAVRDAEEESARNSSAETASASAVRNSRSTVPQQAAPTPQSPSALSSSTIADHDNGSLSTANSDKTADHSLCLAVIGGLALGYVFMLRLIELGLFVLFLLSPIILIVWLI